MTVTPATATISTIRTQNFSAQVSGTANAGVTWHVDGVRGGNAESGMISAAGLYTPPPRETSHTITAISVADPRRSALAAVTVTYVRGMLTFHNDNARTGQNLRETVLTPANVNGVDFGKLASFAIDGAMYAQPLFVADVPVAGRLRDLVIAVTEHASVYAFDANERTGAAVWQRSLIDPARGITTVPSTDTGCADISPEIGITSTPVVDPVTGTLYVVAMTKESGVHKHRLHAFDIATGAARVAGGRLIEATVPGVSAPNDGTGLLRLNSLRANQRAALLLNNGVVYVAFGAYCNFANDNGWMLAYDARTLQLRAAFSTSPTGTEGGIWQGGGGPAADATGDVFAITGDGIFNAASGGNNYGNSFLKLAGATLQVRDYFTPFNQASLDTGNGDLGSGGAMLLPDQPAGLPRLVVGAGKQGIVYLLNRDNLGRFQAGSDSQILQSFPAGACGAGACPVFGTPTWFNGKVYITPADDRLRAFALVGGRLAPAGQSSARYPWPGATAAVSANVSTNGIVWTLQTNGSGAPAILRAHNAADVSVQLYSSADNAASDEPGRAVKFTVPTVFRGQVFVGTQDRLSVYGLLR